MTPSDAAPRPHVFIQTNDKQLIGALVSAHSLKRNSPHRDEFDVTIMRHEDHAFFAAKQGRPFLRGGDKRAWDNDDLQSFTPLRFMPPALMGYRGRAVVIDPDIFAVGDIWELLTRDMQGKAIVCRRRGGPKDRNGAYATSVMLLDCAKLTHWRAEENFEELFAFTRDYMDWIALKLEPAATVGLFEEQWNDFDRLTPATKLLHNTRRRTQPWKTGLPVDYRPAEHGNGFPPLAWALRARRKLFGEYGLLGRYAPHPDRRQEALFFGLLRECLESGAVSEDLLRRAMALNHVRHDALSVIERTPPLSDRLAAA
jgi:hypothetical protein